ncbi:MAG: DUF1304 domain-containing protein [Bdellovibrionales bacterium]|nr:DUF1304 domain-containing protein [Bdellovibrionales bacterium]
MFFWTKPLGMKAFGRTPEQARDSAVLAANQGLYNGFLAAGLVWAIVHPDPEVGRQLRTFFFACVTIAGIYGGLTASRKILFVQAIPGAIGLVAAILISR